MFRRVLLAALLVLGATPAAADSPSVRYRSLERRVQKLKEQSWKLERDLAMLKARLLGASGPTAIVHRNLMGKSFRLLELEYALDGKRVFSRKDAALGSAPTIEIAKAPLSPGAHTLRVRMYYRGHGYGVFEYFSRYRFTVEESFTFTVGDAGATRVVVDGFENGDATVPIRQRPAAKIGVETVKVNAPAAAR